MCCSRVAEVRAPEESGQMFSCGTPTRAHTYTHTRPRHMLAALVPSLLLGDACLFPAVISLPAALRSPPWGLLPLLPILVCCPISEPGQPPALPTRPLGLRDKPGVAARRVPEQSWLPAAQGVAPPRAWGRPGRVCARTLGRHQPMTHLCPFADFRVLGCTLTPLL